MKNIVLTALLLSSLLLHAQSRKILIVSTNQDSVGNNVSGTYLMEIALPFHYFTTHGYEVDVVTSKGGKAAIYRALNQKEEILQIQRSQSFMDKTSNTLAPAEVNAHAYAAIFYPGGHGQYFDVLSDERIAKIAAAIYENGGVVGTAGHGAASLVNIQLSNGKYFVDGKRMTCFPTWAEKIWMNISGYGKLLPLDMEEVLRRRNATLIVATKETKDDHTLTHIANDEQRLVTGSFASSAQWVAEEMDRIIKKSRKK
jgi:putative intracellular protease/amidase